MGQGAVGIDVFSIKVANDAAADDDARFLASRPGGLAGPALHAIGDVLFDVGGRHAAVEGQHLHGRAFERRKNVDGDHGDCQRAENDDAEDRDHNGIPVAERKPDQTIHADPPLLFRLILLDFSRSGGRNDDVGAVHQFAVGMQDDLIVGFESL